LAWGARSNGMGKPYWDKAIHHRRRRGG
jgi:hypothetical protein